MTSNGKSHQEIWDDSLLVNSWNEALEEYKYYHSIHARGEKVEAILEEAENQSERESVPHPSGGTEPLELSSSEQVGGEAAHQPGNAQHAKNDLPPRPVLSQAHHSTPDKGPALPQHLIGQVRDESLKNLLMSWYYAGYYTGLYEGQQQGTAGRQA